MTDGTSIGNSAIIPMLPKRTIPVDYEHVLFNTDNPLLLKMANAVFEQTETAVEGRNVFGVIEKFPIEEVFTLLRYISMRSTEHGAAAAQLLSARESFYNQVRTFVLQFVTKLVQNTVDYSEWQQTRQTSVVDATDDSKEGTGDSNAITQTTVAAICKSIKPSTEPAVEGMKPTEPVVEDVKTTKPAVEDAKTTKPAVEDAKTTKSVASTKPLASQTKITDSNPAVPGPSFQKLMQTHVLVEQQQAETGSVIIEKKLQTPAPKKTPVLDWSTTPTPPVSAVPSADVAEDPAVGQSSQKSDTSGESVGYANALRKAIASHADDGFTVVKSAAKSTAKSGIKSGIKNSKGKTMQTQHVFNKTTGRWECKNREKFFGRASERTIRQMCNPASKWKIKTSLWGFLGEDAIKAAVADYKEKHPAK